MIAEDVIRVTLVGTLLDRSGDDKNVFRRTLESVPEIASACFVVDGPRLTAFMKAVTASRSGGTSALNWAPTSDENAEAWLDGNRFFQRHAVIVGSTGSGKSWAVARIVEQVAALPVHRRGPVRPARRLLRLNAAGVKHLRVAGMGMLG